MCNEQLWKKLVPYLETQFDLVHLPIPNVDNVDEMLTTLLAALVEEKVQLVGFSLGGYLAAYLASKYPEKIARLFVIANSPCSLNTDELQQRTDILAWVNQHGYSGISQKRALAMLDNPSNEGASIDHEQRVKQAIYTIVTMDKDLGESVLIQQLTSTSHRKDLTDELSKVNSPIVFYCSEKDPLINQQWLKHFCHNNKNAHATIVPGSCHMLPLEYPQALANSIIDWANN